MLLNLTYYSSEPIHKQIVNQIMLRVFEEDKLPGDELDSIRTISRQHHIEASSIKRAFEKLVQLGVLYKGEKDRYFVNNISTILLRSLIDRNYYSPLGFSEYEMLKTELNAAKQIQNGLLPKVLPQNEGLEAAVYSTLSDDVGGDFYDIFEIENKRYGILIGDACGKGFPAAMLISQIQAIIKSDLTMERNILQTIQLINSFMNRYSSSRYFASLFYGILDLERQNLTYINAGHNFPMIISNGKVNRLKTSGPAIGIIPSADFQERSIDIEKNDFIFLFTDGLVDRFNRKGEQFGELRIIETFKNYKNSETEGIKNALINLHEKFSDNEEFDDDITFMIIKVKE